MKDYLLIQKKTVDNTVANRALLDSKENDNNQQAGFSPPPFMLNTDTIQYKEKEALSDNLNQKPTGKSANDKAKKLTTQHSNLKLETDVVKVAMKEIKRNKSVQFNKNAVLKKHLPKIAVLLSSDLKTLETEWLWLVNNVGKKGFTAKEKSFFSKITKSTISSVRKKYPKSHAHDWIKNTYEEVFDLIIKHADSDITPSQLYAYTSNEGLAKLTKTAQDYHFSGADFVSSLISGFDTLGLDDFMDELDAKRKPLRDFLPAGFESNITEEVKTNEKQRKVRSARFPNLDTALQGAMAVLKRRRALFLEDAKKRGYTAPNRFEKMFWTYTYFNPGEFGGKAQLEKYKKGNKYNIKERKLSDWITKGEYPHSQRVLQSYKAILSMGIFK